jgi:drug/metabolite transporter (DMT)-like permease
MQLTKSGPGVRPFLNAICTVVIWGATFIATKIALMEVSPATVVWLRFGMGLLVLGAAVAARRQLAAPPRGEWGYFALLGFIGVAFHQWLQANGLKTAQATTTAWIVASTPVFIAILGWLVLKERPSMLQFAGMFLAAAGVLLIISKGDLAGLLRGQAATQGDLLILASAPNWAIYTVLSRRGLARHPATQMMFYVMLAGWLFITIWAMGFGPGLSEVGHLDNRGWTAVIGLGILGSGLAYITYYDALQVLPASQLGVFLNIEPMVTTLLAATLLEEPITVLVALGGAIIILGIYLVNRSTVQTRPSPRSGRDDKRGSNDRESTPAMTSPQ